MVGDRGPGNIKKKNSSTAKGGGRKSGLAQKSKRSLIMQIENRRHLTLILWGGAAVWGRACQTGKEAKSGPKIGKRKKQMLRRWEFGVKGRGEKSQ